MLINGDAPLTREPRPSERLYLRAYRKMGTILELLIGDFFPYEVARRNNKTYSSPNGDASQAGDNFE